MGKTPLSISFTHGSGVCRLTFRSFRTVARPGAEISFMTRKARNLPMASSWHVMKLEICSGKILGWQDLRHSAKVSSSTFCGIEDGFVLSALKCLTPRHPLERAMRLDEETVDGPGTAQ